jgi:hypothetical protein
MIPSVEYYSQGVSMNFDPIIVALVSVIEMLDHANEEEVDPDFAVKIQEFIAFYLNEISADDVREFREILLRIARERSSGDPVLAEYLQRLASGYARKID